MILRRSAFINNSFSRVTALRLYSIEAKVKEEVFTGGKEEISIPYRIQRGPTDILRALASTVKKDPLAPHFKYEDDPYLIPASNVSKRSYALSKEAGKKAARYFLEQYPELFKGHKSDPHIKAYDPPVTYTEKDEVTEDILKSCIEEVELENSLTVYKLLKERDLPCSKETQQALLELLCFYNSTQPPRAEYAEERWYSLKERPKNTWKNNGEADKLFQEMEKDADAYSAMIKGNTKFLNVEKVLSLYEEMRSKEYQGSQTLYNSLLSVVPFMKQDGDMRWQYAMDLVQCMNRDGIVPDLRTMNALLNIASKSRRWNKAKAITMQILAEMKRLNIEPSLGTYYHVLTVFCVNSRDKNNSLSQILQKIEGKEFTLEHPDDIHFFSTAMEICNKVYASKELAYKLNDFLEHGQNCAFLGNALNESIYFRHLFFLLCATEEIEKFMEIYERYIPNTYIPEPNVMLEIIKAIDFCGSYQYLPQILSDVHMFEQTEREDVLSEVLKVAAGAKMEEKHQELVTKMIWEILEKLETRAQNQMVKRLSWTGQMLGDILRVLVNGKDMTKVWHVMQKLEKEEKSIVGHPTSEILLEVCGMFIKAGEFEKMKFCWKYAFRTCQVNIGEDILKRAEELEKSGELKSKQMEALKALLEVESQLDQGNENLEQRQEKE